MRGREDVAPSITARWPVSFGLGTPEHVQLGRSANFQAQRNVRVSGCAGVQDEEDAGVAVAMQL